MKKHVVLLLIVAFITACTYDKNRADAYGNFEVDEVLVSSEVSGKLLQFSVNEGQAIDSGRVVALIDSTQTWLKKQQLLAQLQSTLAKVHSAASQEEILKVQLKGLETEKNRITRLKADAAATTQQLDDVTTRYNAMQSQLQAAVAQRVAVSSEGEVLRAQLLQIIDQLKKSKVVNPASGTILEKYVEAGEVVGAGSPLYKIGNLEYLTLKAYVSGDQLSQFALNDTVRVSVDAPEKKIKTLMGQISWVSAQAEFTPKIIQTKKERVNLVYAIKVRVKNDGKLKLGMPGELRFGK